MIKIINPCKCEVYNGRKYNAFVKIEFNNGRLSLGGVVGPMRSGNCYGPAGQCVDSIRKGTPTEDWSEKMIQKLCNIWDKWHLNDVRPYCSHQKELGWDEMAKKEVTLYHYILNRETQDKKREAEKAAIQVLINGETFTPSKEQVFIANLPYAITTHKEINEENKRFYEPKISLFAGDGGFTETQTLGWLRPEKHPDGILTKECPICGYKYGSSWKKEEVPQDVIDWLFSLPDTKVQPAWV